MNRWRRCVLSGVIGSAMALLAACGDTSAPQPTATLLPSPGTGNPAAAMAGFLAAAQAGDNSGAQEWLATAADTADLSEIVKVYNSFGQAGQGGIFWPIAGARITAVAQTDATHAAVTLSTDIVWCLGTAVNDPAATCSAVNGGGGAPHTYVALSVDGKWKVDVDINRSSQLDHNPQASPTASAPTSSP